VHQRARRNRTFCMAVGGRRAVRCGQSIGLTIMVYLWVHLPGPGASISAEYSPGSGPPAPLSVYVNAAFYPKRPYAGNKAA
jgi:hypothetical protein